MGKIDALWAYQSAELEKEALEREVLNTPARTKFNKLHVTLKDRQSTISRLQEEMVQRESLSDKLLTQLDKFGKQIELERAEFENMLQDDECTAAEITECRQNYERMLNELGATRRELNDLVRWMDDATKEYRNTRTRASQEKKEYDELRVVCEKELVDSAESRKAAEAVLKKQENLVDPALIERYNRVKRNHTTPIAKVANDQCGGCNMSLPTVVVKSVIGSDNIVECENCGRILYATAT